MKRFNLLSEPTEMLYNQGKSAMTDYRIIVDKKIKINCSQDVYNCMKPFLYDEMVENF
ncbi:hypothetical protein [Cyclobacterium marinum]|uniref:hypothetical protein n=1 Tax=Cyclobacterium marinum TaxID=104 RepID=UPI0030DCE52A|tara:strand:+ start:14113 stop:14286 length:174 start_codon:yes stop_codon:yes gene_type:complete